MDRFNGKYIAKKFQILILGLYHLMDWKKKTLQSNAIKVVNILYLETSNPFVSRAREN